MSDDITKSIEAFSAQLKRRDLRSFQIAKTTVVLLRRIISTTRWVNAGELLDRIRTEGQKLVSAHPEEATVANMICRVLKLVRDEYTRSLKELAGGEKDAKAAEKDPKATDSELHIFLRDKAEIDYKTPISTLKSSIIEFINEELLTDIESGAEPIAQQALEHIHSGEVILTYGKSRTVLEFLQRGARKRKFQVIVAEAFPSLSGHEMARALADDGIETVVITDAAVFAMMARVNTVILGTHTIMADGSLKAMNGAHGVCLAAKEHSVPVLVCAATYKLSPKHTCSYDQDAFNQLVSPHDVLPYEEAGRMTKVEVINPVFDYVPADLITLFIFNTVGGTAPSYVYRLLSELYHPDDKDIYTE